MTIVREFREAWRRLARRPGYALLSICVLGVGLGTALAVFTNVNSLVLRPYPFPQATRLMSVGTLVDGRVRRIDSAEYLALHGNLKSADAIGAWTFGTANLGKDNGVGATAYTASRMSASMGKLLGIQPLLGRDFVPADDVPGAKRVVVLSEPLWRHVFQANPHIVGHTVKVNGQFATVVGVLPATFKFPPTVRFWLPLRLKVDQHRAIHALVRLAPGVSLGQARAELGSWSGRLQRVLPPGQKARPLGIATLRSTFSPTDITRWSWLMFGAALLVLVLACINVANLQLVQTLKRRNELALRSAIGCGRWRLVSGAFAESLTLSAAALVPAFAMTWGSLRWVSATLVANNPTAIPYRHGIDGWVIGFALLIALFTTVVAGGVAAWHSTHGNLGEALRDGSKGSSGGFARLTKGLVVAEVALTVILLVGAGTFVRALDHMLAQPTAGSAHAAQVLTAQVSLPAHAYTNDAQRIRFYKAVVERLRHEPGVVGAVASDRVPGATVNYIDYVGLPGHPKPPDGWPQAEAGVVGPHFLGTYGIRLLKGRFFDSRDRAASRPVAVIDAKMAAMMWPHAPALQRQFVLNPGQPNARRVTVIGVVQSLHLHNPHITPIAGVLIPLDQAAGLPGLYGVGLAVRTHVAANASGERLANAVHAVDPRVAVYAVRTQAQAIASSRADLKALTDDFSMLGVIALLLAAAGLYGVLAFSVARRTREIGIRRAIGAGSTAIVRTVGKTLAWQLGIGLVIGVGLAIPWSTLLANPGLRTQAHDPGVFIPVVLIVIGAAVLAGLVPLIRALRVDPAEALRYD